jgi:adenosylmethionine-8-amino-7-oxononanoate aminotransferase
MKLRQADKKYLARETSPEDLQVTRTEGSFLFDARGRKYIDFVAGWCVGNFGWGSEELRGTIRRSKAPDYVYPYYLYRPWVELAELLARITPGKLQKTYRATGGSEAVDIALQVAMAYTGRRKFISLEGSYHGNTIGGVSVGATESREVYPNLLSNCLKLAPPLDAKAAEKVERMLKRRDIAAFIMEPIGLSLGVLIPQQDFMTRLARLCRRYGTLLIMDEVATGFGRTGALFACEHFGIEPDILCMAKAISGGYAPIGATITTAEIADAVQKKTSFYSTYGWHPLCVDVAIRNIRWIIKHRTKLLAHVHELSDHFRDRLSALSFKPPASIRIKGLAIAVETENAEKIAERCRKNCLLLTAGGESLTMFPALTIDRETADAGLDVLERSLA